jgi:hypothetical protein
MAETADELERHIQEIRHDLKDNFSELEDKVKSSVDWRAQFDKRPGIMLALAFGGGILLSALLPRRRSRRRTYRESDRNAQSIRNEPNFAGKSRAEYAENRRPNAWSTLKGAVAGAAAGKIAEFVEELFPGSKAGSPRTQSGRSYDRSGSSSGQPSWQKSSNAAFD